MRRVTLKDGGWADLRDENEVTARGRRAVRAIAVSLQDVLNREGVTPETKLADLDLTEEQAEAIFRMQEASLVAVLAGWSRDEPIPTPATVGDMPGDLYDELSELVAPTAANVALNMSPGGTEPDPNDPSGD